jgi:hypothetical protein
MPHRNMVVVVNRISGQWPPPSQQLLPMIRKEALFPYFRKLHPHGGGRIQGAFGVATVVTQIHCSGEPQLSRILLQHHPMLCCIAAWGREGCEQPTGDPWTHSLVVVGVAVVAAVMVAGIFCLMP